MTVKYLDGTISTQCLLERVAVKCVSQIIARNRHAMEITLRTRTADGFERCLGAQNPWRPVRLGINAPQKPEQRRPDAGWYPPSKPLLEVEPTVSPVAGEILVAPIP